MWCIEAVPLSRRQVAAGLYGLLHPAVHRNLGLIPLLLSDVIFAYWYASLHSVKCVYYAASTARRTENEGLEKLWKARGVTFSIFSCRGWERQCKTSDQIFGILRCYAAYNGSYQPKFWDYLLVLSLGVKQWKTPERPSRYSNPGCHEYRATMLSFTSFLEF
jgi:hypothetical protein